MRPKSHRVIVNIVDACFTNNIGGFNISNFKIRYLTEFTADVIADYEQSILGSVLKEMMGMITKHNALPDGTQKLDVHMSITKFKNDIGYSLVQNDSD
jgi:hypothetical protein